MDSAWINWLSEETLNQENHLFTNALQMSLSNSTNSSSSSSLPLESLSSPPPPAAAASASRGPPVGKKIAKPRKSRVRKDQKMTTYIETDTEHFREMVQRMTGPAGLIRPEARRVGFSSEEERIRAEGGPRLLFVEEDCGFDVDDFLLNFPVPTLESSSYSCGF